MKLMYAFLLLIFLGSSINAQRSYVRKAVRNDIEKKQEAKHTDEREKGKKAVDERLDAWDEADQKNKAGIQPFPTMSFTMQMEYPDKPKNNGSITYYFKGYNCASIMKFDKSNDQMDRTIMNFKEGKSVILMTDKKGRKTGMSMELKTMDWAAKAAVKHDENMLKNGDASVTATNEFKTIEGYKCQKFLYENDKYMSEMWVSNDAKLNSMKLNHAMYNIFSTSKNPTQSIYYQKGMKGVIIQTHIIPKDRRMQECIMTMKDIQQGNVSDEYFSTAGYDITEMPSIRNMWDSYNQEK